MTGAQRDAIEWWVAANTQSLVVAVGVATRNAWLVFLGFATLAWYMFQWSRASDRALRDEE
jgi:uncharacterized membrane protein YphA (DoxX/SURF4 family)